MIKANNKSDKKRWIKNGMKVCHITDLKTIYIVDHVVYKTIVFNGNKVSHVSGVKVYYMVDGKKKYHLFHTKELVPQIIAQIGILEALMFINKEGKYQDE